MTNENSKTIISLIIAVNAMAIMIPQAIGIVNANLNYNKLKQEIQNIQNSQNVINDTNSLYCTENYNIPEYEINVNVKPISTYSKVYKKVDNKFEQYFYDVPTCDTSFKTYMDYRCITDDTTTQWEIQQNAWTDNDGFRRINNDYIVAMGTYYSTECGERFRITFDGGSEITVTVGDIKQDCHTDYSHQYTPVYDENGIFFSGNVLEFIVDTDVLSEMSQVLGTVGHHDYLNGNIKLIERIEATE